MGNTLKSVTASTYIILLHAMFAVELKALTRAVSIDFVAAVKVLGERGPTAHQYAK